MEDLIKEYGLRFTIGISILIILLLIMFFLVPIMGTYIFGFALLALLSFGYCYLIWYFTDSPTLFKDPKIVIIKPTLYDYKKTSRENKFTDDYKEFVLYEKNLEDVNGMLANSKLANEKTLGLILGVLPIFIGFPMGHLLYLSLLRIKMSETMSSIISPTIVLLIFVLFLWITRKMYYPCHAIKTFSFSEKVYNRLIDDEIAFNMRKIYDYNHHLLYVKSGLETRLIAYVFCIITPIVFSVMYCIMQMVLRNI